MHPALPTDPSTLKRLVEQARDRGLDPSSYEALLFQYWLVETTTRAGMGGLVGGDFGGGLLDYKDATEIFEFSRCSPSHTRSWPAPTNLRDRKR